MGHYGPAPWPAMNSPKWLPRARVASALILLLAIVITCGGFALSPDPTASHPARLAPSGTGKPKVAIPVSTHGDWSFSPTGEADWGSVSCASPRFCMAVRVVQETQFVLFDGTSWRATLAQVPEQAENLSVTCPVVGWCMGYDDVGYWIYSNGAWSSEHRLPAGTGQYVPLLGYGPPTKEDRQVTLACTSRTFCLAVGNPTHYELYNGRSWTIRKLNGSSQYQTVGGPLACAPATHLCVITMEHYGYIDLLTYHGDSWMVSSRHLSLGNGNNLQSSCVSTFCLVTNGTELRVYSGGNWSRQIALRPGPIIGVGPNVSCAASDACYLVAPDGTIQTFSHGRLSKVARAPESVFGALSCPTTSFCMLVGASNPITSQGGNPYLSGYYTYTLPAS